MARVNDKPFGERLIDAVIAASKLYPGRETLFTTTVKALLCNHHILVVGPHGTAKSAVMNCFSQLFPEAVQFATQLTGESTEDVVFGPPNIKTLQETGQITHEVDGMLPAANFAFLEEFFDASSSLARSMLTVLNERKFNKGIDHFDVPLYSAMATSNFYPEGDEAFAAVMDRFLFHVKVDYLTDKEDVGSMLRGTLEREALKLPEFSLSELEDFHASVAEVAVPEYVLDAYLGVLELSNGDSSVSDRRKVWALHAAKTAARARGSDTVAIEDLTWSVDALAPAGFAGALTIRAAGIQLVKTQMEDEADRIKYEPLWSKVVADPTGIEAVVAAAVKEVVLYYSDLPGISEEAERVIDKIRAGECQ